MKRKLGLFFTILMSVCMLTAACVSAQEYYGDFSYEDILASIYAQEPQAEEYTEPSAAQDSDALWLQQRLHALGYYTSEPDGIYGAMTEAAVRQFQSDQGLYVDGIAGEMTMAALSGQQAQPSTPSSSSSSGAALSGNLQYGSNGSLVAELQTMLAQLGYNPGSADGAFGANTEAAVRRFQQDKGLYVDGIVGNQTIGMLRQLAGTGTASQAPSSTSSSTQQTSASALQTSEMLQYGMTGSSVQQMQSLLNQLGYNSGTADGAFGSNTEAAVRRFQQDNGLYVDGIAGSQTLSLLSQKAGSGQTTPQTTPAPQPVNTNSEETPSINDVMNEAASRAVAGSGGYVEPVVGEVSGDVYMIQSELKALGYDTNSDGFYTESTISAIKEFQRVNGLYVDGIFGAETKYRLENSPLPYSPAGVNNDTGWVTNSITNHVKGIIAAATNDSMTQDQKLYAVFDYIADRSNYAYHLDRVPTYTAADWPVIYANDMINNKQGDCHGMAALFGYAARMLGYDAYWCNSTGHGWVEINGKIYDPLYTNSSYHTEVYGWTYEQGMSADLEAKYERLSNQAGTFRYIKVPAVK